MMIRYRATTFLNALMLMAVLGWTVACGAHLSSGAAASGAEDESTEDETGPLPLTLYMMSRCPHCADAVRTMVPLVRELGEHVELRIDYLGAVEEDELLSLHGEAETLGNTIELCVEANATRAQWLSFLDCYHRQWREIPDGWEACAEENEVEQEPVARCVNGGQGEELLRASFRRSQAAKIAASPTLVVGEELEIIGARSGGQLAQVICANLNEPKPVICDLVDPLTAVPVTLLTDARCDHPDCDASDVVRSLRNIVWGAEVNTLDYQSEAGRSLYQSTKLGRLPVILIGEEIEDDGEAYRDLRFLRRAGPYYVKTIGRFDPVEGRWMPRETIRAQLLNDRRCPARRCRADGFVEALREVLPSLELSELDYGDADGRALFERAGANDEAVVSTAPRGAAEAEKTLRLPFVVFSPDIVDDEEIFARLRSKLVALEEDYFLPLGDWDPTVEICDNEVDDDEDGDADCADSECQATRGCRPEKQRSLTLYAMSECPYAQQVFRAMKGVVDHFGRDRTKIDFNVEYIGTVDAEGRLRAMHGPSEVEANTRQLCVQRLGGESYDFVDYIACRAGADGEGSWEQCLGDGLTAEQVTECVEGELGPRLLRESYERAEALSMSGSPSWLLNNRLSMNARTTRDIVEAFCEQNAMPECEVALPEAAEDEASTDGGCGE